jgi:hypothetical protein
VSGTDEETRPPLFLVKGDATPEEVAALTVVLQSMAAASSAPAQEEPRSEWAAPHRRLRRTFPSGPGAWRASGLPR